MKIKLLVAAIAALLFLAVAPTAATAHTAVAHTANHRLGTPMLRPDATGTDVAALQWLLSGHRPYAFTKVKPTLKTYTRGISGPAHSRTWKAVTTLKYRIGYPGVGQCSSKTITPHGVHWKSETAGPYFFALLLGHKQRPSCWVALASKRLERAAAIAAAAPTAAAARVMSIERGQLGVVEQPPGSNRGCRISYRCDGVGPYQAATGAFGLAWCVSFQQWSFVAAGLGTFAGATASVDAVISNARYHGWLNAKAKPGALVAWYGDRSHIGLVWRVRPDGFDTYEGNTSDSTAARSYTWSSARLHYFVWNPAVVR